MITITTIDLFILEVEYEIALYFKAKYKSNK